MIILTTFSSQGRLIIFKCLDHGDLELSSKLPYLWWVWVIEGGSNPHLGEYYTLKESLTKFCPK